MDLLRGPLAQSRSGPTSRCLRSRLAAIIRRLALSAEEIDKLPDNYGIAVASAAYPRTYDPAHAEKAFLPPDLFAANGPWVHVQTGGSKRSQFVKPTASPTFILSAVVHRFTSL
jgi:hypothetical protein